MVDDGILVDGAIEVGLFVVGLLDDGAPVVGRLVDGLPVVGLTLAGRLPAGLGGKPPQELEILTSAQFQNYLDVPKIPSTLINKYR